MRNIPIAIVTETTIIRTRHTSGAVPVPSKTKSRRKRMAAGVFVGGFGEISREKSKMNGLRKLASMMVVIAAALISLPAAAAPEKKFSVGLSPNSVAVGNNAVTALIRNETPGGNSSVNSLKLTLPLGYEVVGAPTATWSGSVSVVTGSSTVPWTITISNMAPLKPQQSFNLSLTAKVTGSASTCLAATWNAQAWTGSSFSGDTFRQVFSPPDTSGPVNSTTQVVSGYNLTFAPGPQNALSGQVIPPPVGVSVASACGPANAQVEITVPGCTASSGCLTGNVVESSGGVAAFTALKIMKAGTYSLTASAPGFASATSSVFTVYDGELNCGDPLNPSFMMPSGAVPITEPGYAAGSRGSFNKDGAPCVKVAYDFSNNLLTDNSATLRWNTSAQPNAAFVYTVTFLDESVNPSTGTPTSRTKVAWEFKPDGTPLHKVYGVACIAPLLPAPYGTLTSPIGDTDGTIYVSASASLPATPFAAMIGSERIQVTAVSGAMWTVVRGTGQLGADKAPHSANATVMSTPLPIDPNQFLPGSSTALNPYYQRQAHVCIADEGWVVVPGGVRFTTTIYDIGDGFVNRDL